MALVSLLVARIVGSVLRSVDAKFLSQYSLTISTRRRGSGYTCDSFARYVPTRLAHRGWCCGKYHQATYLQYLLLRVTRSPNHTLSHISRLTNIRTFLRLFSFSAIPRGCPFSSLP
ncbi:hypothetical protein F4802DRAFT_271832 [Xylaria palmicola]|nr:hypothetical protein F4802DRAFT_271832 [Xylaria palmicola]